MKLGPLDELSYDELESIRTSVEFGDGISTYEAINLVRYIAWLQDEVERVHELLDTARDSHEARQAAYTTLASQAKCGVEALELLEAIRAVTVQELQTPSTALFEIRMLLRMET